ncbi:MAG: NUDIX domain-containing protein [Candidatus Woesearchaeota archaeon]
MSDFAISVKAFVVNSGKLLLIKRVANNPHKPGAWEVPGGRLGLGEDPFEGLKRETKEETGIEIEVKNPLRVHHLTRADGQIITMITFFCTASNQEVVLSEEHDEFLWIDVERAKEVIHPAYYEDVDNLLRFI